MGFLLRKVLGFGAEGGVFGANVRARGLVRVQELGVTLNPQLLNPKALIGSGQACFGWGCSLGLRGLAMVLKPGSMRRFNCTAVCRATYSLAYIMTSISYE